MVAKGFWDGWGMGLIFGKVAKSCAGYAHAVEAVWGSLDHSLFASAIGRDLTCLNILGTGPSLPPKQKRVRRVLVQAGLPPTRFFKPRGGGRARSLYATPPPPPPPSPSPRF